LARNPEAGFGFDLPSSMATMECRRLGPLTYVRGLRLVHSGTPAVSCAVGAISVTIFLPVRRLRRDKSSACFFDVLRTGATRWLEATPIEPCPSSLPTDLCTRAQIGLRSPGLSNTDPRRCAPMGPPVRCGPYGIPCLDRPCSSRFQRSPNAVDAKVRSLRFQLVLLPRITAPAARRTLRRRNASFGGAGRCYENARGTRGPVRLYPCDNPLV